MKVDKSCSRCWRFIKGIMVWVLILLFCIGFWVIVVRAFAEPIDLSEEVVFKYVERDYYRVKINEKASMEDLRWLFNTIIHINIDDPELFKGKEKSFTLEAL